MSILTSSTVTEAGLKVQQIGTIAELRSALLPLRREGKRIVCVPTMGALHEGHLKLMDAAKLNGDVLVATIFVNPLQFGPNEDLNKYPRTIERDITLLSERGVNFVFTPSPEEMYSPDHATHVSISPADSTFEGAIRPGHFTGVLTVVTKLFNIVQPDAAIFGQKDLQQLSMIRRMVHDLDMPIDIVSVPIVREADGLAMSSRNRYLSESDRVRAGMLYKSLMAVRKSFEDSGVLKSQELVRIGREVLEQDDEIRVDYLATVDPSTFNEVTTASRGTGVIVAARIGSTRLIDNIIL